MDCVTLQEMKEFLRLNSGSFSDNLTVIQSIAPSTYEVTTGYAIIGAYTNVFGHSAVVILDSGIANGTIDVKIQESDDHITWTDWAGGAFEQITTANDNAAYEKEYTGTKQYIRAVAKVSVAPCSFGVSINKLTFQNTTEDSLLSSLISTACRYAETYTRRQFIAKEIDLFLNAFPEREIKLPYGNLKSVTAIKYTDSDGVETTMTEGVDYVVDNVNEPGRIVPTYGKGFPTVSLHPVNPIRISFIAGYGTAADVPSGIKTAIKMLVADMYENRESQGTQQMHENKTVSNLLAPYRLWAF